MTEPVPPAGRHTSGPPRGWRIWIPDAGRYWATRIRPFPPAAEPPARRTGRPRTFPAGRRMRAGTDPRTPVMACGQAFPEPT